MMSKILTPNGTPNVTDGYAFFMTTPFKFNSKNVPALVGRVELTERHKSSFEFDVRKVD